MMPTTCVIRLDALMLGLLLGLSSGCGSDQGNSVNVPGQSADLEITAPAASKRIQAAETSLSELGAAQSAPEAVVATIHEIAFPSFEEVAEPSGLSFTYSNGASGRVLMVEATGGGAGWLDLDRDGRPDLYLCQGGDPATDCRYEQPLDQLFRQKPSGAFEPVTESSTIVEQSYSQGVAIGDFDDDGFDDIFVTNVGPDTLLRNQGDGTFQDVSVTAGIADALWSTSAAWGDLDSDGDLDLYVCNYVDYDPYHPLPCGSEGKPGTCHPMHVEGVPDACFINHGDGTFSDESQARGLFGPGNKALGVVIADFNNDGLPDVYVANDTTPNFLFINQGSGIFVESSNAFGCAVSRDGLAQASMGVAAGDFDQNGWLDLYCTHFTKESNTLYKNLGVTGFQDVTGLVGLHTPTLKSLGFGTVMKDFNQDGHEDIFVTNGHVDDWRSKGDDYEMQPQLFSYEGPRFIECKFGAGDFFSTKRIGRGVAYGDFDVDGDWDLAVVHQNAPVAILQNTSSRGNWLKLRCIAIDNRRGVGVRVVLHQEDKVLTQVLAGGTSYCSSHEGSLIFGLGDDSAVAELEVHWPDGTLQRVVNLAVNQEWVLRQMPDGLSNSEMQYHTEVFSSFDVGRENNSDVLPDDKSHRTNQVN
jgi:hypothetical protein